MKGLKMRPLTSDNWEGPRSKADSYQKPKPWHEPLMKLAGFGALITTTALPYVIETSLRASESLSMGDYGRIAVESIVAAGVMGTAVYKALGAAYDKDRSDQMD